MCDWVLNADLFSLFSFSFSIVRKILYLLDCWWKHIYLNISEIPYFYQQHAKNHVVCPAQPWHSISITGINKWKICFSCILAVFVSLWLPSKVRNKEATLFRNRHTFWVAVDLDSTNWIHSRFLPIKAVWTRSRCLKSHVSPSIATRASWPVGKDPSLPCHSR